MVVHKHTAAMVAMAARYLPVCMVGLQVCKVHMHMPGQPQSYLGCMPLTPDILASTWQIAAKIGGPFLMPL